jgi:hypothetical protein
MGSVRIVVQPFDPPAQPGPFVLPQPVGFSSLMDHWVGIRFVDATQGDAGGVLATLRWVDSVKSDRGCLGQPRDVDPVMRGRPAWFGRPEDDGATWVARACGA